MSTNEEGEHNPDHIDWKRNIASKKKTKQDINKIVKGEISRRFKSINGGDLMVFRDGSDCNGKRYTVAMIWYAIYFNQSFTMMTYGMLLGLVAPHHNMEITKDWLIRLGIMVESEDNIGVKVYGIVGMIRQPIQYAEDDGIEEQLTKLLLVGNDKIKVKKIKINTSGNKRKQVTARAAKLKANDKNKRKQDIEQDADNTDEDDPTIVEL
eukprot:CAMPEP_0170872846 /NCGR_PEP_ID=MMETSP0734-20130129/26937_1 /TAXON_ID=186038 /ORGANISM="Fragilariopsis kerguelensis, Strain L26-C5" /LENGTH=208 /DNA_ID=CAMNT_0011252965 /DNA_START=429 /DNA_END=1055 /DNA_ORIENTATION=+